MKYAVMTTENGFIEELEVYGKTYRKEWVETDFGFSTDDPMFIRRVSFNIQNKPNNYYQKN